MQLFTHVHTSTIHSSQEVEAIRVHPHKQNYFSVLQTTMEVVHIAVLAFLVSHATSDAGLFLPPARQ